MTKNREVYRCTVCGNVVEVVNPGAVLSCCGQPMKLMKENTTDGAKEKHVPVIEKIAGGYRVSVGSVEHPMLPEHYIQWIELLTPTDVLRHELKPGEKPVAVFLTDADAKDVTAREYCNLHGLWKGDFAESDNNQIILSKGIHGNVNAFFSLFTTDYFAVSTNSSIFARRNLNV